MKRSLIHLLWVLFVLLNLNSYLYAQECGTVGTPMPTHSEQQFLQYMSNSFQGSATVRNSYELPLKIHIIRTDAGTGGVSINDVQDGIVKLNEVFEDADIHFYQCGSIDYIDDSEYYVFKKEDASWVADVFNEEDVINVYFADEVIALDGDNIAGFSKFPWSDYHLMVIDNGAAASSTFPHEMGHYLGLFHTHETANGVEYVNGSNCSSSGDYFCDTPADPKLSNLVNSNCQYTGNETDPNGHYYNPDPTNIMSYSRRSCRINFTDSQYDAMTYFINTSYPDLVCDAPASEVEMTLLAPITVTPNPIICGESFSVHTDVWNTGETTFFGDFTAAIFNNGS